MVQRQRLTDGQSCNIRPVLLSLLKQVVYFSPQLDPGRACTSVYVHVCVNIIHRCTGLLWTEKRALARGHGGRARGRKRGRAKLFQMQMTCSVPHKNFLQWHSL